jgi:hypothetical protein
MEPLFAATALSRTSEEAETDHDAMMLWELEGERPSQVPIWSDVNSSSPLDVGELSHDWACRCGNKRLHLVALYTEGGVSTTDGKRQIRLRGNLGSPCSTCIDTSAFPRRLLESSGIVTYPHGSPYISATYCQADWDSITLGRIRDALSELLEEEARAVNPCARVHAYLMTRS